MKSEVMIHAATPKKQRTTEKMKPAISSAPSPFSPTSAVETPTKSAPLIQIPRAELEQEDEAAGGSMKTPLKCCFVVSNERLTQPHK